MVRRRSFLLRLLRPSWRVVFACTAATTALGCGHTDTYAFMLRPAERPTSQVALYLSDREALTRPYYEVAIVEAVGFGGDANAEDVARALSDKAGTLGCDAVVRATIDVGYSRAHAAGVCVKFSDASPRPESPQ